MIGLGEKMLLKSVEGYLKDRPCEIKNKKIAKGTVLKTEDLNPKLKNYDKYHKED